MLEQKSNYESSVRVLRVSDDSSSSSSSLSSRSSSSSSSFQRTRSTDFKPLLITRQR